MPHNNHVSGMFQAGAFFITLFVLVLLFSFRFNLFIAHDPTLTLTKNESIQHQIDVGLYITNFTEFNVTQNKFDFEGIAWFAFDPKTVDLDIIKKFDVAYGELLHVSDPILIKKEDKTVAQFDVRIAFNTPLNYRLFPLDDHHIEISLINRFLPENVQFSSDKDDITLAPTLQIPGWRIIDHNIKTGYVHIDLKHNDKQYGVRPQLAIIALSCERSDPSILASLLLTFLLMLFIAMFTFSSSEDNILIVSVGIVALVGYRAFIRSLSPPHAGYFIFADYIYLISLLSIIGILVAGAFVREKPRSLLMKKGLIIAIYTFFAGSSFLASVLL